MDINTKDTEAIKEKTHELKYKKDVLENKITTIQQISARFSMRYGESEEKIDELHNEISELDRQIALLSDDKVSG
ncbi:MAG: hypothetical protein AB9844_01640 [Clostridiaceae bacterium]